MSEEMKEVLAPYNTLSEEDIPPGFLFLVKGYTDYAKEIITDRAIGGIDGFKISQRRILYAMKHYEKVKDLTKSNAIIGSVAKLHPHGDASAYDTMVRMVDSSKYMGVPFLHGKGDFGTVVDTEPPAASRYTEAMFSAIAEELFKDMTGVNMVFTEDGHYTEPELLPTPFPNVLCNPMQGIAVGVASNIPSLNYHEVLKATIELIETGDIAEPLAPDYPTGGYYVYNRDELNKIMNTGRGRIKLRGKYTVEGNTILISEVPYYTTSTAIIQASKEIEGISRVREITGLNEFGVAVECRSKRVVEEVLTRLLDVSDLQMQIKTNITVIIDNVPRQLGVKDLLKEWVKFRAGVVKKTLTHSLERLEESISKYELLVDLMSDDKKRDTFIHTLTKVSKADAANFLRTTYKDHPSGNEDTYNWIFGMSISTLSGIGTKENKLSELKRRKAEIMGYLDNIPAYIVRELKDLNTRYSFPRKTEITDVDYVFDKSKSSKVKATPTPVLVIIDGKFIKKLRLNPATSVLSGIQCMSDDVISFIDDQGRLLRVHLENIEFCTEKDRGIYLSQYLEVEDDYEVICYELIGDKKVGYVYSDGFASVVDYSEWVNSKRATRMTEYGVSPLSSLIVGEFDFTKTHLLLFSASNKFAFVENTFKQKHRTSRTKLISTKPDDPIVQVIPVNDIDMLNIVSSPNSYLGKLRFLASNDRFNMEYLATLIGHN